MLPSLPNILDQLTMWDVRALDWLYRHPNDSERPIEVIDSRIAVRPAHLSFISRAGVPADHESIVDANLTRLGLIAPAENREAVGLVVKEPSRVNDMEVDGANQNVHVMFPTNTYRVITVLGVRLVQACSTAYPGSPNPPGMSRYSIRKDGQPTPEPME
jgi:hypothetical protein